MQVCTLWQMTAARDPHNALYWLYAARAADQGRRLTEAAALFAHALQQEPHCAGAWLGMAQAAQRRGDVQAAKQALAQLAASVQMAPSQAGFARSILTLDAQEQISFNHLMHTLKDAP
jgi:predicted Zn-dependent protease